ncbi:MAG TPA: hypothetical protein VJ717_12480 [Gemmatimonadaceae bacterium]|nr:hypothetical protein [Gemmatimonadaceae bacterium]
MLVLEPVRPIFRTFAAAVVPELRSADPNEWSEIEQEVERALIERPNNVRRQLASFLRLLDWWPLPRHGKRLTKLDSDKVVAVLRTMERHPLLLIRRGIWGLRTLVFLGYYTRADVAAFIGYRAHRDGWSARPESARERPSATPQDVGIIHKRPSA